MKRFFLSITALIVLSGCSTIIDSPHYYQDNTHQFKLNESITVSAGSSDVYILDGKVVRRDEIDTFDVYCKLSVPRSKESEELIIEPDVFKISNTYQRNYTYLPLIPEEETQVASLQLASISVGNGGSSRRDLTLYFELEPEIQTFVKSMSCIRFADPRPYNFVTLEDAQNVFKDLGSFSTQ